MELREFSNTYFAVIPADIVGCVDDYVPHKMRTNFVPYKVCPLFKGSPVTLFQKSDHEYVLVFLTTPNLVVVDITTTEFTILAKHVSCTNVSVDRNGRILYCDAANCVHVVDGLRQYTLRKRWNTDITALTILENDMCAMTDGDFVILRNYVRPDSPIVGQFRLPNYGPKIMNQIFGFHHSTNLVITHEGPTAENDKILLFDTTGNVLRGIVCPVVYLAIDSTDQIIVLEFSGDVHSLHIFSSELDALSLMSFCGNFWHGPFVVDRLGYIHCYDAQQKSLLVLK